MGYVYLLMFLVAGLISLAWTIGLSKAVDDDTWEKSKDDEFMKR